MFAKIAVWAPQGGLPYPETLTVGRVKMKVRVVAELTWNRGTAREKVLAVCYDKRGVFFTLERITNGVTGNVVAEIVNEITPERALPFIVAHWFNSDPFRDFLIEQFANPEFSFDASLPVTTPKTEAPRRRSKTKESPFAVQMELATALVEVIRELAAAPDTERLAEACRSASAVHAAIHAPENFKLAAG